jgi:hypothetical protein
VSGSRHSLRVEHRTAHDCQHVRATCSCGWASPHWYAGVPMVKAEHAAHERRAVIEGTYAVASRVMRGMAL